MKRTIYLGFLRTLLVGALLACTLPVQPVLADPPVTVRVGEHPGFGRIVLNTYGNPRYAVEQSGNLVVVRLPQSATLERAPAPPHNVESLRASGSVLELTLQPGATVHPSVISGLVVIDV